MSPESTSGRIPYQPALDGLRGVAVAAVLLYHGNVSWAEGGFLGVDVFFVLSGYLITALLVAEWSDRGRIDLLAFWGRRVRRLLPALFLVLAAVAAYATFVASPAEMGRIRSDGLAGLLYVANWHQIFGGQSYFDQFVEPSPLSHLWSLGIEEQWYLVWPPLVALWLLLRPRRSQLVVRTAVLACASAALMSILLQPQGDLADVYFRTDTRAQALLAGAALAYFLGPDTSRRDTRAEPDDRPSRLARWSGALGAGVLAAMVVGVDGDDRWLYRGGFLLAAVATVVVIRVSLQPGVVRRVLGATPLVRLGRISYGVYLWHLPVYVALNPERIELRGSALLGLRVGVTVALAAASYHFVEEPIRARRWLGVPRWQFPVATAGAAAVVAVLLVGSTLGAEPPLPVSRAAAREVPTGTAAIARRQLPPNRPVPSPDRVRVLLVGDSVAFSLGWHIERREVPQLSVRTGALIGCGVVRGRHLVDGEPSLFNPECADWPTRWSQAVESFDPDVSVIMIGAWEIFDREVDGRVLRVGTREYEDYLTLEIEEGLRIVASRGAPVVLLNVPCYQQPDLELGQSVVERNDPERTRWLNRVLTDLVARHSARLRLVDIDGFLCPDGRFVEEIDGVKMRRDGVHFTPEGAQMVWRWLAPQLVDVATRPGG